MTRLTHGGLAKRLAAVTVIMTVPILGGSVAGILVDRLLGTSPAVLVTGFVIGNVVAALGVWLLVRRR